MAPINNNKPIIVIPVSFIKGTKLNTVEKSNDPNKAKIAKNPILNPISPTLFIVNANIAALLA
jgi:hypothetical protein